ncbi:RHS repeat-associated core domain-containing protein [Calidifontibacter indicus]|uniref:RHS repeat-associated core domain-containing protein n=1 Tax=Calidifontibacter indicus TaxID=419650 RepID=UPI003D7386F1
MDDLPAGATQSGVTTTFTVDSAGRRTTQSTTGGTNDGVVVSRGYADSSDNPGWSTTTPKPGTGAAVTTRYTDSISGDLGAMITTTGDATITLLDPHDSAVTAISVPATQTSGTAATGITGWSGYSEYGGTPVAGVTGNPAVTGPLGYGWLGGKQREKSADAAGLILMGVRYYNWVTGTFTAPDPVAGGNNTTYGYPTDPVNTTDTTGQWGCGFCKRAVKYVWKKRAVIATVASIGVCAFSMGAGCVLLTATAFALRAQQRGRGQWRQSVGDGMITVATFGLGNAFRYGSQAAGRRYSMGYFAASTAANGPSRLGNANYLTGYPRARSVRPSYTRPVFHRRMVSRRGWDM